MKQNLILFAGLFIVAFVVLASHTLPAKAQSPGTYFAPANSAAPSVAPSSPATSPAAASPAPASPSPTTTSTPPLATSDLKTQYVNELTVYRSNEQDFLVAKQQYSQLQTLGNLDAAVTAFKTVQTSRTQTIILYLQTLLSEVTGAKGMDLTQQALETQKLQTMIADYQQHLSDIGAAPDVVALSATATTFTNKEKAFESLSYELLALLRITNMQSAVDQLTVASTLLQTQAQAANLDPTTLATKQRGFDEVSRTIDAVKVFLTQANQFHARLVTQNNYSSSSYSQLAATLGKGYPQVSQAESFLRELAGLPSL